MEKFKPLFYLIIISLFFSIGGWDLIEVVIRDGGKFFLSIYIFLAVAAGFAVGVYYTNGKN